MAQRSGTTCEIFHFGRFGAHLAYPSPGSWPPLNGRQTGPNRQKMEARGVTQAPRGRLSAPMAPLDVWQGGGTRWHATRGLMGPVWGSFGPLQGGLGPSRPAEALLGLGLFRAVTRPPAGAGEDFGPRTSAQYGLTQGKLLPRHRVGPFVQLYPTYRILTHF